MSKKFSPLAIEHYPKLEDFPVGFGTNCLAFALGIQEAVPLHSSQYDLRASLPIKESFEEKVKSFGLPVPRYIATIEEALPNEYVLMVWNFTTYTVKRLGMEFELSDFHVARRELDGTWVQKPGWYENPCIISQSDWTGIFREFGSKYILFAIQAE